MASSPLLSALSSAGILERPGSRRGAFLRVSPRFLAHAEATAARCRARGMPATPGPMLQAALGAWDEYRSDPREGADLLLDFLDGRSQFGALQPVFPALEHFASPPAATA